MCIDIILLDTGSFRLALPISIGAMASPFSAGKIVDDDPETTVKMWHVGPAMTLGLAAGS